MITNARIVAAHIYLAREGSTFSLPAPGTVGRESKPGSTDAAWVDVGLVEDFEISREAEQKEIMAAVPGRRVRWDLREVGAKLDLKWTCQELTPLAMELVTGATPLTSASTQFNPLEAGTKKFWAKIQLYDETDTFVGALDVFGTLKVGTLAFGQDYAKPAMEFAVIHSTLATGTL